MNKIIKKMTILPLVFLVGCTQKGVELDKTQAKEQLTTMKAEIEKDSFTTPTKIMLKTLVSEKVDDKTTETDTIDFRVNTEVGFRYFYLKSEYKKTTTSESATQIIYEKDSKYYCYTSVSDTTTNKEYSTEAEFKTAFDESLSDFSFSPSDFKSGLINYLEMAESFLTVEESQGNIEVKFTKYNESTFTCTMDYTFNNDKESGTIKFENYLFTLLEYTSYKESTKTEEYTKGTVTYNTIDYTYPDQL